MYSYRRDKTRAASLLNEFKDTPRKAFPSRVRNNDAFVDRG